MENVTVLHQGSQSLQIMSYTSSKMFKKPLKLIDKIGSFSDAVDMLKELGNIKGDVKFVSLKNKPSGLLRLFMGEEDYGSDVTSMSTKTTSFVQFLHDVYLFVSNYSGQHKAVCHDCVLQL